MIYEFIILSLNILGLEIVLMTQLTKLVISIFSQALIQEILQLVPRLLN